jgi:aryl-alcohol dehydrogenase-like predicted oxidoreductase
VFLKIGEHIYKMIHKIVIGSASFGCKYGIVNDCVIKPIDVFRILRSALDNGFAQIDTASSYIGSEKVIGDCNLDGIKLVTKIGKRPLRVSTAELVGWVRKEVDDSLKRLRKKSLYGLLLHHPEDLLSRDSNEYLKALMEIKEAGLVQKIGFSLYDPTELDVLTCSFWPEIIQVPINVFDTRFGDSGWLERIAKTGTEIQARSVFLQGLILSKPMAKSDYFKKWDPLLNSWFEHLAENKVTPLAGALLAVANIPSVTKIIVGVNSFQHFKQIISTCASIEKIGTSVDFSAFKCNDKNLIDPRQWVFAGGK